MGALIIIDEDSPAVGTFIGEGPLPDTALPASTLSYSDVPFGAAQSGRVVAMVVFWAASVDANRAMSAATIGGVAASIAAQDFAVVPTGRIYAGIISAVVPTGTSGSVSLTFAGNVTGAVLEVYNITGLLNTTVQDSDASTSGSIAIGVTDGGFVVFGAYARNAGTPFTLTGVTEDMEFIVGDFNYTCGSQAITADNAAYAMSASPIGTGACAGASFR